MALQTNNGGALYELVARGVKDAYFFEDSASAANPFSWSYEKYAAVSTETRAVRPYNAAGFGRVLNIDLDVYGDILQEAWIHVTLPSWVPPVYRAAVKRGLVRDASGSAAYGYTSAVGYMLFEKIEILQDNITLQEVTGDALYVTSRHLNSYSAHHLSDALAGVYDEGDLLSIQRSVDPDREYIIEFPFLRNFPLVALRGQRFRVRLTLRALEDLVICSDLSVPKPAPWAVPAFAWNSVDASGTFVPLALHELAAPTVSIEMTQVYLSNEDREALAGANFLIPYRRYISYNHFNFGPATYASLDAVPPVAPAAVVNYDGIYHVDRILHAVRSARSLEANRRTAYNNVTVSGEFYIAGLQSAYGSTVRDQTWGPLVLNKLTQHAHAEYASAAQFLIQENGFKPSYTKRAPSQTYAPPAGLNYSEAMEPNVRVVLNDIQRDYYNDWKVAAYDIILCATAYYAVEKGRGGLAFLN
jgi:hypothetical protein